MVEKVFVSYRRSDTAIHATALKIVLEEYLPDIVVFVDTASIDPGDRWPQRLTDEIAGASAFLAVIGKNWRFSSDGSDRLAVDGDWVRVELAYALQNLPGSIIPVLIFDDADGSGRPDGKNFELLPADLAALTSIQSTMLRSSSYVEDAGNIARVLARNLNIQTRVATVEYPTPNALKSKTPKLTQNEFDKLRMEDDVALSGWKFFPVFAHNGAETNSGFELRKVFKFKNFKRAFSFMHEAALVAEARPHHPVWTNQWNIVDVHLRTFDAGHAVTWYDVEMAAKMNRIASSVERAEKPAWPIAIKS